MSRSQKPEAGQKPTFSRAIKEEVLQYFQVKGTAIYIHFALEHHEEIPEILEEFSAEGLITHQPDGHLLLTKKGRKALARLRQLREG